MSARNDNQDLSRSNPKSRNLGTSSDFGPQSGVRPARWQFPKRDGDGHIQCPHCGSKNWRCWDEREDDGLAGWTEDSRDEFDDQVWRIIGYMACNDCHQGWLDEDPPFPLPAGYFPEGHGSWKDLMEIPF